MVSNLRFSQGRHVILIAQLDFRATGYLTMKVGKVLAVAVGGSIILLQVFMLILAARI